MSIMPSTSLLSRKVFVTPAVATVSDDLPPGETTRMWSPISSILIYGERDAVLVDTPTTNAQAAALADWVQNSGKDLTTIYTTHGHGDHFSEMAFCWSVSRRQGGRYVQSERDYAEAIVSASNGRTLE
jgi:glyoxylase-like metal-dependent hydrolase (beta-lactamase superfamily II)